jgi:hypothetical protein
MPSTEQDERFRKVLIVLGALICCFPAGFVFIWTDKKWTKEQKWIWTGAATVAIVLFMAVSRNQRLEQQARVAAAAKLAVDTPRPPEPKPKPSPPKKPAKATKAEIEKRTSDAEAYRISMLPKHKQIENSLQDRNQTIRLSMIGRSIHASWKVSDNFTQTTIVRGAKMDARSIIERISESDLEYDSIDLSATANLTDKFGQSRASTVVQCSFSPETVSKIAWGNFLTDNIYDIADSATIHPLFVGK